MNIFVLPMFIDGYTWDGEESVRFDQLSGLMCFDSQEAVDEYQKKYPETKFDTVYSCEIFNIEDVRKMS